jgi:MFS family permease
MSDLEEERTVERLWTKPFILMTIGNLFLFNAFYMLYPTLPLFIKQMGGNESQVGLAMGAFMLSAVIFRPLVGGLLDRFGRRPFIVWGLLLFTLAMYMYNWVGGIVVLMGLRILHGMSWAVSTTATITAITDMIPSTRRGEGMGWFSTSMTLAMAIGPLFGIWVTQNLSYSALFVFAVVLSTAALLLTLGAKMPFRPQTGARRIELFEKSVLPVAASLTAALPPLFRCSLTPSMSIQARSFWPSLHHLRSAVPFRENFLIDMERCLSLYRHL